MWPNLPALSNTLSVLTLVLGAAFLLKLSQGRDQKATGMIAALLFSLSPHMLTTSGAETCFYIMLILAGFYAYDRSRLNLTAAALALAAMARPDGLIAAGALGIYHLARRRRVEWQPVVLYAALVGAWYIGLWLYFGSPVPATLMVKQQQGQMSMSTSFQAGFLDIIRQRGRQPLYWLHGALGLVGVARVVAKSRHWVPLLAWTVLYFAAYTLLGVTRYFWYYAPLVPASIVLVAEGATTLLQTLARVRWPRAAFMAVTGLLLVSLLGPLLTGTVWIGWRTDPRLKVYREIGQWLEAHTPREASVGALEVGVIGYYAQRPMTDFAGLIQPDVARQFTSTSSYLDSADWAIRTYHPDYVVLHREAFSSLATSDWFRAAYMPVRDFTNRQDLWLTIYHRSKAP
jgi:hypothetical protein